MGSKWQNINANYRSMDGYKRVAWPPEQEFIGQPHRFSTPLKATSLQFEQRPQQINTTTCQENVDYQVQKDRSVPQDYSRSSPGTIVLRQNLAITQTAPQIYNAQPAAITYRGGCNMRGDLKWPPTEYKKALALQNDQCLKMLLRPACRPRRIQRDYTSFFAKNAVNSYYPGYKVPPGTQRIYV